MKKTIAQLETELEVLKKSFEFLADENAELEIINQDLSSKKNPPEEVERILKALERHEPVLVVSMLKDINHSVVSTYRETLKKKQTEVKYINNNIEQMQRDLASIANGNTASPNEFL